MASVLNQPYFHDEEAAYEMLESIVWPNGSVCPHCNETKRTSKMQGKATRPGLRKCYACRKQFRVTVGTVFEASHIKLHQWLQAAYLMCSSKKGISRNQMARTLGVTVKTGWFVTHRLREAMKDGSLPLPPMGGVGKVVKVDGPSLARSERSPRRPVATPTNMQF
jgi:transposase-like protein